MSSISTTSSATEVVTITENPSIEKILVLKLKNKPKGKVRWTQETVNNEFMRKKSSKLCCVYHKSKKFGESDSDETDSDEEKDRVLDEKQIKMKNMKRFHA